ncbi:MAG TPA: hypothetical protein VFS25_10210 [Chitinophaga sp.]|uniref:hypothetical protein n=1 Tax=Chitinophaga sp. TaxID=1869181 RepID=UPI002DB970CB|nr:hypothetical protein [Chitinophaga sp.]HEU4553198.1 hypothetical protein [Chitinophaga sp.]
MQHEPSIFDKEFLQEAFVRRRRLMPLALKIYVWFYIIVGAYTLLSALAGVLRQYLDAGMREYLFTNNAILVFAFCSVLLAGLRVLSNIFIWVEKKTAIRFTLIVVVVQLVSTIVSMIYIRMLLGKFLTLKIEIAYAVLEIPYVLMLLKIKKAWETTAVSGKELNRQL